MEQPVSRNAKKSTASKSNWPTHVVKILGIETLEISVNFFLQRLHVVGVSGAR